MVDKLCCFSWFVSRFENFERRFFADVREIYGEQVFYIDSQEFYSFSSCFDLVDFVDDIDVSEWVP